MQFIAACYLNVSLEGDDTMDAIIIAAIITAVGAILAALITNLVRVLSAKKRAKHPSPEPEHLDLKSKKLILFRGTKLPTFEVNVLRELEKGREKSFKPVAEIDTYTMSFIVEKERVVGLGLGKWGYSWDNEKAQTVPESIGRLTALKILDMSYADINYIPEALGNLTALERLNLKSNRLAIVPDCICNLTSLIELELDSNSLK